MERFIMQDLIKWKEDKYRKPLILKGARQIGKTYILKKFGETHYENVAYFNFDHDDNLGNVFANTKEPKRIIEQLTFINKKAIEPGKTLIIFDEVQECPNALNSLKYFCEDANEYHIIAAGSLLGIRLFQTSFPVGKVDFLDMYPMTFKEFLKADDCENLVQFMESINEIKNIPDIFFNMLVEKLKAYFIVGGMPEIVNSWVNEKSIERVDKLQDNILKSYESDFSKHVSANEANKISIIWNSIPSQLSRENKKFLYQVAKDGARAREYESALNWLNDSNLIYKIYNISKVAFPLKAYADLSSFKIYMMDIGLLRRMSNLDSSIVISNNDLFEEFKGAFSENYTLNMLVQLYHNIPYYFVFDRHEVDYLIQVKSDIVPIEVKSNKSTNNASLTKFNNEFSNRISIRFSLNNLSFDGKVLNIPLFLIEHTDKLIKLCLDF